MLGLTGFRKIMLVGFASQLGAGAGFGPQNAIAYRTVFWFPTAPDKRRRCANFKSEVLDVLPFEQRALEDGELVERAFDFIFPANTLDADRDLWLTTRWAEEAERLFGREGRQLAPKVLTGSLVRP